MTTRVGVIGGSGFYDIDGLTDAAKALAMTVTDLLADPETMAKVSDEFGGGQ